jgi:hypothetical protein
LDCTTQRLKTLFQASPIYSLSLHIVDLKLNHRLYTFDTHDGFAEKVGLSGYVSALYSGYDWFTYRPEHWPYFWVVPLFPPYFSRQIAGYYLKFIHSRFLQHSVKCIHLSHSILRCSKLVVRVTGSVIK